MGFIANNILLTYIIISLTIAIVKLILLIVQHHKSHNSNLLSINGKKKFFRENGERLWYGTFLLGFGTVFFSGLSGEKMQSDWSWILLISIFIIYIIYEGRRDTITKGDYKFFSFIKQNISKLGFCILLVLFIIAIDPYQWLSKDSSTKIFTVFIGIFLFLWLGTIIGPFIVLYNTHGTVSKMKQRNNNHYDYTNGLGKKRKVNHSPEKPIKLFSLRTVLSTNDKRGWAIVFLIISIFIFPTLIVAVIFGLLALSINGYNSTAINQWIVILSAFATISMVVLPFILMVLGITLSHRDRRRKEARRQHLDLRLPDGSYYKK